MSERLPERYHAGMRFRVTSGAWRGEVGDIASVDFETGVHELLLRGGTLLPFLRHEVELTDHENCTAPCHNFDADTETERSEG